MKAEDSVQVIIESPSGARFEAEVAGDMPLLHLAADFFDSQGWPLRDDLGRVQRPVVEMVNPQDWDETKRLDCEASVSDAGIRSGDVLRIFPESVAGCFLPDVEVQMADGRRCPICELGIGDALQSYDTGTHRRITTHITEVFTGLTDHYLTLNGVCQVTATHPILSRGTWTPAGDLKPGDDLTGINGNRLSVASITRHECPPTPIYNLRVSDPTHCFFAGGLLVHNMDAKEVLASLRQDIELQLGIEMQGQSLKAIDGLSRKIEFIESRLIEADAMRRRLDELEFKVGKIGEGFQALGQYLQRVSFVPTKAAETPRRVEAEIRIRGDIDTFDEEQQERVLARIAQETTASRDQIRLVKITKGSLLVTIEISDEAAHELLDHISQGRPYTIELGMEQVVIRRLPGQSGPPRAAALPAPISEPVRILILASNPIGTERLRLDEEFRRIDEALMRRAEFRASFKLELQLAVSVSNLKEHLLRFKPHIVHFSGHGSDSSEIILEGPGGTGRPVSRQTLSSLFKVLKDNIRCVVLNLCFSEGQAAAIAQHIDCVIGMTRAVGDEAAISFSESFYQGLGYGRTLAEAFQLGTLQIDLDKLQEADVPRLIAEHVDPSTVRFV